MTVSELRTLVDNLEEYIHVPGGIDRLKKMVLHLAVTGQLVPQDPSEGTGEHLYGIIQAKKAELVKQGKIKKQKAVADVDHDELPFIIPTSWKWARLGDILSKVPDGSQNPPKGTIEGLPMLSSRNVTEKGLDFKNIRLLSDLDFANENKRTDIQEDDVLLTIVGSIGRSLVVNMDHGKFTLQRSVAVLTPIACDPYYVSSIFIQSPFMQETLDNEATGTAQRGIYLNQIKMLYIPLPPFAEQKRIVAKVDSIFALIDHLAEVYKTEQAERSKLVASSLAQLAKGEDGVEDSLALAHLSEIIRTKADAKILRQTILHLAVSGQLVPQNPSEGTGEELYRQIKSEYSVKKVLLEISEDDKPFNIPDNWRWVRLPEIYRSQPPVTKLKTADYLKSGKYPIVDQGQRYIAGYTNDGEPNKASVPVTVFGDHTREIKLIDFDFIVGADGVKILEPILVDSQFFYTLIDVFRPQSRGYGRHFKMLNDKIVPLPPLAEQKRIVTKTTQLLDLVAELERHLEK